MGPRHRGEGVGLQPVGMDQVRRGPAEHRPQPPDEPDRRRGLSQRGQRKPEPGQSAGPPILPQSAYHRARPGSAGSGTTVTTAPSRTSLGLERAAGEQHHLPSCARKVFARLARIAASKTRSAPPTFPIGIQKGDSHLTLLDHGYGTVPPVPCQRKHARRRDLRT